MPASSDPRVDVGVLLIDNQGRVLLTLRKLPPDAGCWSIVGGKVDVLETLQQCAIREGREEVGLKISLRSLLSVTDHYLPGENQHWVSPAQPDPVRQSKELRAVKNSRSPVVRSPSVAPEPDQDRP